MKVLVIQGGPSTEAAVSRASGAAVVAAIEEAGHNPWPVELDATLAQNIAVWAPDVAFPVTHGELGEDGCLQGLLEVMGLPYVGSGVRASAIAADKVASKLFFQAAGLPLARQTLVTQERFSSTRASALLSEIQEAVGPAFIIKPSGGGSTIGVTRILPAGPSELAVDVAADMVAGLKLALELSNVALIEAYHSGIEVNCGVLEGSSGAVALPPTLIEPLASDWYDFESKYKAGGSRHVCPAPLSADLTERIQAAAVSAHRAVGARDLSRSDFIIATDGSFVVLELNNLPGMTSVSLFPEAARAAGIAFPELVDGLVRRAFSRGGGRAQRGLALPS